MRRWWPWLKRRVAPRRTIYSEEGFARLRERMVEEQLVQRGVSDARVLEAMRKVPRHRFVPQRDRSWAYEDHPLPIGHEQTISQPYVVALMTQLLELQGEEKVLEIGTGSGFQAALLGELAGEVHSVERIEELARRAANVLKKLGFDNVQVHVADGSEGWPEDAPYDAILAAASAPRAPKPLLEQLVEGGRLVLPVGMTRGQVLQRWRRIGDQWEREDFSPVAFVPMIGKHGWGA